MKCLDSSKLLLCRILSEKGINSSIFMREMSAKHMRVNFDRVIDLVMCALVLFTLYAGYTSIGDFGQLTDEQWQSGLFLISPLYLFLSLSLCSVFYLRSSLYSRISMSLRIVSSIGDRDLEYDDVRLHQYLSYLLIFVIVVISFSTSGYIEKENVEYEADVNGIFQVEYASPIIIECDFNEECVAASILGESLIFWFLEPGNQVYEAGDENYNSVSEILVFPTLVLPLIFLMRQL